MSENRFVNYSIIFIALVILAIVLKTLESFLRPFAIAIILTFLLMPLVRASKKKKIPFGVTLGSIVIGFVLLLFLAGFLIQEQISEVNKSLPNNRQQISKLIDNVNSYLSQISISGKSLNVRNFITSEEVAQLLSKSIAQSISTAGAFLSELFLVILFVLFLIPSHEMMMGNTHRKLSRSDARNFTSIIYHIENSVQQYLFTKSLISLGTAIVSAIILLFFGSEFIIGLAFLFFVLNFIPNIGSFIAVVFALAAYALTFGLGMNLVWLGILLAIVQVVFGNYLDPKISGNRLKLSPIVILLGLFLWGWIWGIMGMLLAVPLTSIIKIIMEHFNHTKTLAKSMTQL